MSQYISPTSSTPEPPSVTLPDGRKLSYFTFGVASSPSNPPPSTILYLHSSPSSGIEASHMDSLAISLSSRIIAPNRPGHSTSSAHPSNTILSTISDLANLISSLTLPPIAILAAQAGAPFALGLATVLPPERLKAVAILSGTYPASLGSGGMHWTPWLVKTMSYYAPGMLLHAFDANLGRFARDTERPEVFEQALLRQMVSRPKADLDAMQDESIKKAVVDGTREAVRVSSEGAMREGTLLQMDWGFDVADVKCPVWMWHGAEDGETPARMAGQVKDRIKGAELEVVDGEAGISVVLKRREVALQTLKAALEQNS
ncbi:Hypothetical protein D9617_1g084400 [Elsinoe fawcettii]|nr:Hypothetical protein D9617_1g084400 [Elsinoe fawcettii]